MHEHVKLSLWDIFSYYLTGWALLLGLWIHAWAKKVDVGLGSKDLPSTVLALAAFLLPLLCGLLVEPLANVSEGVIARCISLLGWARRRVGRGSGSAAQDSTVTPPLRALAEDAIPEHVRGGVSTYHWCRDYLLQERVDTPYMAFLAKFGFYRNMSFLLAVNSAAIPFIHGCRASVLLLMCFMLFLSIVYGWRSWKFYGHMGKAIYGHYLVSLERDKRKSEGSGDGSQQ